MESLSTAEVVNQLRRIHREYQCVTKALEIAEAVNNANTDLQALQQDISGLTQRKNIIQDELRVAKQELEAIGELTKKANLFHQQEVKNLTETLNVKKEKIKEEILKAENLAISRTDALNSEIKQLSTLRNKAIEEKVAAETSLKETQDKLKQLKQKLIESL